MNYLVQLETAQARPTAVVQRRARRQELPKIIPESCGLVWNVIRAQQIKGAGRHVSLYLDDQINLEVGVELDLPFAGHGEVVASTLPAGPVATTTHCGPYNRLNEAHQAIRDWCANHGYTPAGPNWEIYGHWLDEWNGDPSKIRTDIFYLLIAATQSPRAT
jgi:effector-binding domain-containing protein